MDLNPYIAYILPHFSFLLGIIVPRAPPAAAASAIAARRAALHRLRWFALQGAGGRGGGGGGRHERGAERGGDHDAGGRRALRLLRRRRGASPARPWGLRAPLGTLSGVPQPRARRLGIDPGEGVESRVGKPACDVSSGMQLELPGCGLKRCQLFANEQ